MRRDPSPGSIRVVVHIADMDGQAIADVPVKHLAEWLKGLETLTTSRMVKGTGGGALVAAEIFRVAMDSGEYLVACLAATWISLYGDGLPPRLRVGDGRSSGGGWRQADDRRHQRPAVLGIPAGEPRRESGGFRTVPSVDFDTVGNA
jgi:hypothetical protein